MSRRIEARADRGHRSLVLSARHAVALAVMSVALCACSKAAPDPAAATTGPVQAGTAPATAGGGDTSVPDASSVLRPADAARPDAAAAGRANGAMTRGQESSAMPMPGQNNDHSAPLPPARRASGT